ncbi:hypothetical protein [Tardiphaga sp.]|jgi:hypothetical protein|uniref:hypothetical protein n=1 Tax=Tardiphaga sp. TaxID=1926292 RepID=UPI0037DA352F
MSQQTDIGVLVTALGESREILGRYIEPGDRDAVDTVNHLLEILDDVNVVAALDRAGRRRALRMVELDNRP